MAVHISPRLSGLAPDDSVAELRVTVACGTEPASGTLRLLVPDELAADVRAPGRESASAAAYDLPARGYADWDVRVRARPGTPPGRYVVAAQISDDLGQVIEDTAFVQAGGPGEPDLYQPLDQVLPAVEASTAATAAELDLAVLTPALRLAPGATGEVAVEVTNRLASPLRAEAQLVSPFGSWEALGPWTQGLHAAPGTRAPGPVRGPDPGPRAARDPVVGAGQDHVLRPGPVQRGRAGDGHRRGGPIVTSEEEVTSEEGSIVTDAPVAVVTGAGSGIGRDIAAALSKAGYRVTLSGRRAQALQETAELAPGVTLTVPADVRSADQVQALFDTTRGPVGPGRPALQQRGRVRPGRRRWKTWPRRTGPRSSRPT